MRFDVKYKTFKILRVKLLIALFNFFLFSNNILIRLQISIKYNNNNKLIIR